MRALVIATRKTDVAGEIIEHRLLAFAPGRALYDPGLRPDGVGQNQVATAPRERQSCDQISRRQAFMSHVQHQFPAPPNPQWWRPIGTVSEVTFRIRLESKWAFGFWP
jgi:hypothetical protein